MPATLQVERDPHGLQLAVRELFEESFFAAAVEGVLQKVSDEEAERVLFDAPVRSLSPGYYDRSAYLLDLGSAIEAGAVYSAAQLDRSDVVGLQCVKRAKAEFEADHPSCPACGVRQDNRFMHKCKACQTKFAGKGN